MKIKFIFILNILLFISALVVQGQSNIVSTNMKVYGNCVMCKKRIETALDHGGIKKASWDPKTKVLAVIYNRTKISEQQIAELIAAAGHDTDAVKASDEVYAKLPFCCLYRDDKDSPHH